MHGAIIQHSLRTIHQIGAMSTKTFKIISITNNVLSGISAFTLFLVVLTIVITNLVARLATTALSSTALLAIYLICFLVYFCIIVPQSIVLACAGVRVLWVIRARSQKTSAQQQTRPFPKIIGLIIGMSVSAFLQMAAAIISIFTSLYFSDGKLLDYFLHCFSVLIFAVFVLLLYNPLLSEVYDKDGEKKKLEMEEKKPQPHLLDHVDSGSPMTPSVASPTVTHSTDV